MEIHRPLNAYKRRLFLSVFFTLLLFAVHSIPAGNSSQFLRSGWVDFLLTTPVFIWGGLTFFQGKTTAFRISLLNRFTLLGLALLLAFGYSFFLLMIQTVFSSSIQGLLGIPGLYFKAAATFGLLAMLGQVLEFKTRSLTSEQLHALLELLPSNTKRIHPAGQIEEICSSELRPGDLVQIRPGELLPADGEITEGTGLLNESWITGESLPINKNEGMSVLCGTQNQNGNFTMQVKRCGSATFFARLVELTRLAQKNRINKRSLVDRSSAWLIFFAFCAVVLIFAFWKVWGNGPDTLNALACMVAAFILLCPAALSIAPPLSLGIGLKRSAVSGVLIHDIHALETLEKIDTLVLDKTGTLTEGKPKIVSMVSLSNWSEIELLRAAATLEKKCEHPFAAAFLREARERKLELLNLSSHEIPTLCWGRGVQGHLTLWNGQRAHITLGSVTFLKENKMDPGPPANELAKRHQRDGQTLIWIGIDNTIAGFFGITDPLKESSFDAIQTLITSGIHVIMLSGDRAEVVHTIAKKLKIQDAHGEMLPDQKIQFIKNLQKEGRIVAMVGNGVNDAPALAHANVGIAMGSGAPIALEAASIVLLNGELCGIIKVLRLSQKTMENLRQNIFFSVLYNILALPLAVGAFISPFGAMSNPTLVLATTGLGVLTVGVNALRLKKLKL